MRLYPSFKNTPWLASGVTLSILTTLFSGLFCISAYSTYVNHIDYKSSEKDSIRILKTECNETECTATFYIDIYGQRTNKIEEIKQLVHSIVESENFISTTTTFIVKFEKLYAKELLKPLPNGEDIVKTYQNIFLHKTITWCATAITTLVILITLSISTYYCFSRHSLENQHTEVNRSRLNRLQQSLDRSILRYNTLGLALFCFTLLIVAISGMFTFTLFASTIKDIKGLAEEQTYNASIVLLYIIRTSLLAAFLTTTIIVFYKFSKSAIDQSVRFLKRKHATKFLRYLIDQTEQSNITKITINDVKYLTSGYATPTHYISMSGINVLLNSIVHGNVVSMHGIPTNLCDIDKINEIIDGTKKALLMPATIPNKQVTLEDVQMFIFTNVINDRYNNTDRDRLFALISADMEDFIASHIARIALLHKFHSKINAETLSKLMSAFDSWNADIGSAFGDSVNKKKGSDGTTINYILDEGRMNR